MTGKITQEDIERARAQIGVPQYERNAVFNTVATGDTISHFAFGIGDDNPLWHDPDYGRTTRWRGQIAPPLYATTVGLDDTPKPTPELKKLFKGLFRGVGKYYSGATWEWYRPIGPGDVIYREYVTVDVQVKEDSSFAGGLTVIDTYRLLYVNRFGDPVAAHELSFVNAEREGSKRSGRNIDTQRPRYGKEDIERIDALYAAEQIRGTAARWWEDVQVGEALTSVVKGPLRVCDVIGFHIGWGMGQTYGAGPLRYGWKHRQRTPAFYVNDEFGVPDIVQRMHWDEKRAVELGLPAPYDYGTMRTNWLGHLITNWMGDEAWLLKLKTEMRGFNYVGDTTICSGEVVAKRVEGVHHLVELKVQCTNQRDEVSSPGAATVVLPSKSAGAVVLPTPPAAFVNRGANMMAEAAERIRQNQRT